MNIGRLLAEQNRVLWWPHWRLMWCSIAVAMKEYGEPE